MPETQKFYWLMSTILGSLRIYTTNAIESLNSVIRCAVAHRKLFPSDESAMKVIYLAISQAAKKWTMPIQNWRMALNRFMIQFEERIQKYAH